MARFPLTLAVAQTDCALGDVDGNLSRHLALVERARGAGADLLLFPELSLTGYGLGADTPRVAMAADDPRLARLAAAAGAMTVVAGFVEEGEAAHFYNAAAVLRGGGVAFVHRKLNLPTYGNLAEGKLFAAGRTVATVPLGGPWRAAVMVCADVWNPALVHLAAADGATLLLVPTNSAVDAVGGQFSNPQGWDVALRFYGLMYGMPVAMANRVGTEGDARFWGGSRIVDPFGEVSASASGEAEGLITAVLDYDDVRRARFQLPTVRDADIDLVAREAARLAGRNGPRPSAPGRGDSLS